MMNFNIQLFADNLQNTTATMSKEMKTFYEKRKNCITCKLMQGVFHFLKYLKQ